MVDQEYKKILLIQTAFIGDLVLSTPLIKAIKIFRNSAILDVVTSPQTKDVLKNNPYVIEIINFLYSYRPYKSITPPRIL
jgi:heptosyltransferase-2